MEICNKNICTACKACLNICPRAAIDFKLDELDNLYADINQNLCIGCGLCKKVCPQINLVSLNNTEYCYAGWSLNDKTRKESASGGIASEIYKEYAGNDNVFIGAEMIEAFETILSSGRCISDIERFKNSRYVYADPQYIYREIASLLKKDIKVVFIGTSCQVAALKSYINSVGVSIEKLLLVDLVCHGVSSPVYLKNHINNLQEKYNFYADKCCFRDPEMYTYTFTFTLRNNGQVKYARRVHWDDMYQIGYHYGIIYRNNCYECIYAKKDRVGDITLADFSYVGAIQSCLYDNKNVSCILCNTSKGKLLLESLLQKGKIFLDERPIEEEWNYEKMLSHPTLRPKERRIFVTRYIETKNFDKSMWEASWKIVLKNKIKNNKCVKKIRKCIPRKMKIYLRCILSN